jgi:3-hydroxyacyl-[acyl-carrier-protein] dehydratase
MTKGHDGEQIMQLDFEEIKKLIPQRFPFIMLDKVLEVEPGNHAISIKNISGNDILFLGHFPEKAIMPGVAILEAMAQTAIVLFAAENNPPESSAPYSGKGDNSSSPTLEKEGAGGFSDEKKGDNKNPIYFLGSVKARFFHPVVPGDQLKIKAVNVKSLPNGAFVSAEAFVDDKKVSEAELVFNVK